MTLENVLQQVRQLSDSEKLALIESTANMFRKSRSIDQVAGDDNLVARLTEHRQKIAETMIPMRCSSGSPN
jgi:hypothetical protein